MNENFIDVRREERSIRSLGEATVEVKWMGFHNDNSASPVAASRLHKKPFSTPRALALGYQLSPLRGSA